MAKRKRRTFIIGEQVIDARGDLPMVMGALLAQAEEYMTRKLLNSPKLNDEALIDDAHQFETFLIRNFLHQVKNLPEAREFLGQAMCALAGVMDEEIVQRVREQTEDQAAYSHLSAVRRWIQ